VHVGLDARVPDGRRAIEVEPDELRAIAMRRGVAGVDMTTGYSRVVELYANYVQGIYDNAGRQAVAAVLGARAVVG
jgi:hypothetical protein